MTTDTEINSQREPVKSLAHAEPTELLFCPSCNGRDVSIALCRKLPGKSTEQLLFVCETPGCGLAFWEEDGTWLPRPDHLPRIPRVPHQDPNQKNSQFLSYWDQYPEIRRFATLFINQRCRTIEVQRLIAKQFGDEFVPSGAQVSRLRMGLAKGRWKKDERKDQG